MLEVSPRQAAIRLEDVESQWPIVVQGRLLFPSVIGLIYVVCTEIGSPVDDRRLRVTGREQCIPYSVRIRGRVLVNRRCEVPVRFDRQLSCAHKSVLRSKCDWSGSIYSAFRIRGSTNKARI